MPEPFKNSFNLQVIRGMARHFKTHWPDFDDKGFCDAAANKLESLELKERSDQITQSMASFLPTDFKVAGEIILCSLGPEVEGDISSLTVDQDGIAGWAILPVTHYVGLHGQGHFALSMKLLKELTKRFSSEFGIRFFLQNSPKKTLATLKKWTSDNNHHVRRLVSEGVRPRLPWAMQLPVFIEDPSPVIELLELLKDDNEEYVRRSVANNLNDISKDHPEQVARIAQKWIKGASPERKKLIRHGCRTLLKNGNKKVLRVFGYKTPAISKATITIYTPQLIFGNQLEFELSLTSTSDKSQALMIDYIIHHRKANGKTSAKIFKWMNKKLQAGDTLCSTKKHAIKKITTRKYYPGIHSVEILINGVCAGSADFNLLMP